MKRIFSVLILFIILLSLYTGWNLFGPVVSSPEKKFLFIKTGSSYEDVKGQIISDKILSNIFFFNCKNRILVLASKEEERTEKEATNGKINKKN